MLPLRFIGGIGVAAYAAYTVVGTYVDDTYVQQRAAELRHIELANMRADAVQYNRYLSDDRVYRTSVQDLKSQVVSSINEVKNEVIIAERALIEEVKQEIDKATLKSSRVLISHNLQVAAGALLDLETSTDIRFITFPPGKLEKYNRKKKLCSRNRAKLIKKVKLVITNLQSTLDTLNSQLQGELS
jgi:hypothetical protein